MPVRLTERNFPRGFTAEEFGQQAQSDDKSFTLISYLQTITINTCNEYIVFVDENHANRVKEYRWYVYIATYGTDSIKEIAREKTAIGYYKYSPFKSGNLLLKLEIIDYTDSIIQVLKLSQTVRKANALKRELAYLRNVLTDGHKYIESKGAYIGDLAISNEVFIELREYIWSAINKLRDGETTGNVIPTLLLISIIYREVQRRPKTNIVLENTVPSQIDERALDTNIVAQDLNVGNYFFDDLNTDSSIGVCQLRFEYIAMIIGEDKKSTYTEWKKISDENDTTTKKEILDQFLALTHDKKIDIFNLLRFPKMNIYLCAKLIDKLTNRPIRHFFEGWDPTITDPNESGKLFRNSFLGNEKAIKIVATEFNTYPTSENKEIVKTNSYSDKIYSLLKSTPFMSLINSMKKEEMDAYRYFLSNAGKLSASWVEQPELPANTGIYDSISHRRGDSLRLLNFIPTQELQKSFIDRNDSWRFQSIWDGRMDLNMDFYGVKITKLPINYSGFSELFNYIKTNFLSLLFVPAQTSFSPMDPQIDLELWKSDCPIGAVFNIDVSGPDYISVVVSHYEHNKNWIFTTIKTSLSPLEDEAGYHPLCGHREFGFIKDDDDSIVFYTRAADRANTWIDNILLHPLGFLFTSLTWEGLQQNIFNLIITQGGDAEIIDRYFEDISWGDVQKYYSPENYWITNSTTGESFSISDTEFL